MNLLLKSGHIIDPSQGIDTPGDVVVENGRIKEIIPASRASNSKFSSSRFEGFQIIDASGRYIIPGLIDMHCHLREPGFSHKETIKTGTMAGLKGGFISLCCMPNTNPVNDNETVTEFILRKAHAEGVSYVYPIGAITKAQKGEELAELGKMHEAGCIAFSDDGRPVTNTLIMRRALEYSRAFGTPIISHAEDIYLSEGGVVNEGRISSLLGLRGIPKEAEEIIIGRDIILARLTRGRLHIAHVSTKGGVELIRRAKQEGINVTAETCPHYFTLTEDAVKNYNTNAKVNPPLRTEEDVEAIIEGLRDGTIDAIATDHAPHHIDEKLQEFDKAPSGISGLETALSLSLGLVHKQVLTLSKLIEKMTLAPAKILNINKGTLKIGEPADIVIIDLHKGYRVEPERFFSKGKNTPFAGRTLKGMVVITICKGKIYEFSGF